jgi:hypothetical protein
MKLTPKIAGTAVAVLALSGREDAVQDQAQGAGGLGAAATARAGR